MAYNLINASLLVLLFEVSQIWLWRYQHWVLKNKGFIQHHKWKSWQITADKWHFKACCNVLVFKDFFFFPLKALLVGINQGRHREWVIPYSGQQPFLRGSFCWVQNLPQGWFLWESSGGSKWGGELSGMESVCRGGAAHGAGHGPHENRNQGSDLVLGVGAGTRNNLQAWRKYSIAASSWSVCIEHYKTLGSLICGGFFYLCDFFKYLMFMNSGIWGSEL